MHFTKEAHSIRELAASHAQTDSLELNNLMQALGTLGLGLNSEAQLFNPLLDAHVVLVLWVKLGWQHNPLVTCKPQRIGSSE